MAERSTGTPCWVDIATSDIPGAIAFYGGLFGWDCQQGPPEVGGYTMCLVDGKPAAAISPVMGDAPATAPYWTTYLASDDADATVAAARANGATVTVEPFDVMSFGRMAMISDPAGVTTGIWEKRDHRGFLTDFTAGAVCWHEHISRDDAAGAAFLGAVFGLEGEAWAGMPGYRVMKKDGVPACGLMQMRGGFPEDMGPQWMAYVQVDDVDAACEKVVALGGSVPHEAFDVGGVGRIAMITDTQGGHVGIVQPVR